MVLVLVSACLPPSVELVAAFATVVFDVLADTSQCNRDCDVLVVSCPTTRTGVFMPMFWHRSLLVDERFDDEVVELVTHQFLMRDVVRFKFVMAEPTQTYDRPTSTMKPFW